MLFSLVCVSTWQCFRGVKRSLEEAMAFLDISNQTIDGAIVGIGLKSARRIAAKVLTAATPAHRYHA